MVREGGAGTKWARMRSAQALFAAEYNRVLTVPWYSIYGKHVTRDKKNISAFEWPISGQQSSEATPQDGVAECSRSESGTATAAVFASSQWMGLFAVSLCSFACWLPD